MPGTAGKVTASGYVDGLAVADTGGGPRQRPQALVALRLDATGSRTLSAHVELRGRAGGPFEGGHPGTYNFVHEFQNYSPALEVRESAPRAAGPGSGLLGRWWLWAVVGGVLAGGAAVYALAHPGGSRCGGTLGCFDEGSR